MKLTYCTSQLLAWAETGRAPDPAVDAAARAVDIDDLGRRAFLAGKDALAEVVADLDPESVEVETFDRLVARSLAIVVVIWHRCLPDPAEGRSTAYQRQTYARMLAFAERLGRFPEMPPAVLERLHVIVPPPSAMSAFESALESLSDDEVDDETPKKPPAPPSRPSRPPRPPGRLDYALKHAHPAMWAALVLAVVVALATCGTS